MKYLLNQYLLIYGFRRIQTCFRQLLHQVTHQLSHLIIHQRRFLRKVKKQQLHISMFHLGLEYHHELLRQGTSLQLSFHYLLMHYLLFVHKLLMLMQLSQKTESSHFSYSFSFSILLVVHLQL